MILYHKLCYRSTNPKIPPETKPLPSAADAGALAASRRGVQRDISEMKARNAYARPGCLAPHPHYSRPADIRGSCGRSKPAFAPCRRHFRVRSQRCSARIFAQRAASAGSIRRLGKSLRISSRALLCIELEMPFQVLHADVPAGKELLGKRLAVHAGFHFEVGNALHAVVVTGKVALHLLLRAHLTGEAVDEHTAASSMYSWTHSRIGRPSSLSDRLVAADAHRRYGGGGMRRTRGARPDTCGNTNWNRPGSLRCATPSNRSGMCLAPSLTVSGSEIGVRCGRTGCGAPDTPRIARPASSASRPKWRGSCRR